VIDQDTTHLSRCNSKEMRAILPGDIHLNELHEGFMHDGRRLKRVTSAFSSHVAACPAA
jgi:hypothetical protein